MRSDMLPPHFEYSFEILSDTDLRCHDRDLTSFCILQSAYASLQKKALYTI